ncbi:hypothetical protein GYMLUDRAFT_118426, partial [Collybiopsis luxurians FD-317 M1]
EAAGLIVDNLDADQYVHIKGIDDDPLAMIEKLRKYHTEKGMGSLNAIYSSTMHTHKKESMSIEDHIKNI